MDYEIDVIQQHPLRLLITFNMRRVLAGALKPQLDLFGNGLDLPGVAPAAHHKIIGEGPRILFQFENRDLFGFLVLRGGYGFEDLLLRIILHV
jgi:hypothetical protein